MHNNLPPRKIADWEELPWTETKITELRRWVVERFFERELDEDYELGARAGHDQAKEQIQNAGLVTAKKNHPGLALALEALK
jgi:hypothetical protein